MCDVTTDVPVVQCENGNHVWVPGHGLICACGEKRLGSEGAETRRKREPVKAWWITHPWFPGHESVYIGETVGKAKYNAYLSARDARYDISFTEFRARRAPEFDELAREARARWSKAQWYGHCCLGWRDDSMAVGCLAEDEVREAV